MDIEEIKKEVIYTENLHRLFEISINLAEEISKYRIEILKIVDATKVAEMKGKISLLITLQKIAGRRMDSFNTERNHKKALRDRQFVSVAKFVLSEPTYERIREISNKHYTEIKEIKSGWGSEKLE